MSRKLSFLDPSAKQKRVRTTLYNDQRFSQWELEVLHTPVVQRLYDLKQLGFADRVYPDAVHSRFNHILGVMQRAEEMGKYLVESCKTYDSTLFQYGEAPDEISGKQLAALFDDRIDALRLIAMLHDLTHAAYGHTLEDEVVVFVEKHDEPQRQIRFFDTLIAQLIAIWSIELGLQKPDTDQLDSLRYLSVDAKGTTSRAEELMESIGKESVQERDQLLRNLRKLELAMIALLHIEYLHSKEKNPVPPPINNLLLAKIMDLVGKAAPKDTFIIDRDAILIDVVGNTICADLLDYALRDSSNAGLRVQFDVRLLRYVVPVVHARKIRLAIQFFTDKMRHDVLSEMSGILKARYLISERVLFHPTKCAAGAMLGTAIQLLGLRALPNWVQSLGDIELLRLLTETGNNLKKIADHLRINSVEARPAPVAVADGELSAETISSKTSQMNPANVTDIDGLLSFLWPASSKTQEVMKSCILGTIGDNASLVQLSAELDTISANSEAARWILWRLTSRRFPKLIFRLRTGIRQSGEGGADKIADTYSNRDNRFNLERKVERICRLPIGSVFIHCPPKKNHMKVAEALVVGQDLTKADYLRDVTKVCDEGLEPYQEEITAVEKMYKSIWQFHVFLDNAHIEKRLIVASTLEQELHFRNDTLLKKELELDHPQNAYDFLATDLKSRFAADDLPEIIDLLDIGARKRLGPQADEKQRAIDAINTIRFGHQSQDTAKKESRKKRKSELPFDEN